MKRVGNSFSKDAEFVGYVYDAPGQQEILRFPFHCEFYHSLYLIEFLKAISFLKKDQIAQRRGYRLVKTFPFYFSGSPGRIFTSFMIHPYPCIYAPGARFIRRSVSGFRFSSSTSGQNLPFRSPSSSRRHGTNFQLSRYSCVGYVRAFGEGVYTIYNAITNAIYIIISHTKGKPGRGSRVQGLCFVLSPYPNVLYVLLYVLFFIAPFNITARQRLYSSVCRAFSEFFISHLKLPCLAPGTRESGKSLPERIVLFPGLCSKWCFIKAISEYRWLQRFGRGTNLLPDLCGFYVDFNSISKMGRRSNLPCPALELSFFENFISHSCFFYTLFQSNNK